jgi:hypothetical protein
MVNMLVIGFKVRGFKPGRADGFLRAIKIRSPSFFGGELNLSAQCRKILRHKQTTCKYEQKYFARLNSLFSSTVPPACYQMTVLALLPESSVYESGITLC